MRLSFRLCATSSFVTKTGDCPDVSGNGKAQTCCARQCLPTSDCFISGKLARTAAANGDLRQGTDCMTQRHAALIVTRRYPILGLKDEKGFVGSCTCQCPCLSYYLYLSTLHARRRGRHRSFSSDWIPLSERDCHSPMEKLDLVRFTHLRQLARLC
jgi:hypothetical protein